MLTDLLTDGFGHVVAGCLVTCIACLWQFMINTREKP